MSKIIYSEARKKFPSNIDFSPLDKLPGKTISLAAVIQYIELIPKVKAYLKNKGMKVMLKQGAFYEGHVIGCNSTAFDKKADTLLLIGDGKFQAINNALQLDKEIYIFNPETFEIITKDEINELKKKIKGKINKFLMADNIGLIISTKYGQNHKQIENLKKSIQSKGKNISIFEGDNINISEFENFPDIQMWVNTACYGMAMDSSKIVNYQDVLGFL